MLYFSLLELTLDCLFLPQNELFSLITCFQQSLSLLISFLLYFFDPLLRFVRNRARLRLLVQSAQTVGHYRPRGEIASREISG